jgi:hypothetical protein
MARRATASVIPIAVVCKNLRRVQREGASDIIKHSY